MRYSNKLIKTALQLLIFCIIFNVYSQPTIKEQLVQSGLSMLLNPQITEDKIIKTLQETHAAAQRYQINPSVIFEELRVRCEQKSKYHKSKIGQKHEYDSLKPGIVKTTSGVIGLGLLQLFYRKLYKPTQIAHGNMSRDFKTLGIIVSKRQGGWGNFERYVFDWQFSKPIADHLNGWLQNAHHDYPSLLKKLDIYFSILLTGGTLSSMTMLYGIIDLLDFMHPFVSSEEHKQRHEKLCFVISVINSFQSNSSASRLSYFNKMPKIIGQLFHCI